MVDRGNWPSRFLIHRCVGFALASGAIASKNDVFFSGLGSWLRGAFTRLALALEQANLLSAEELREEARPGTALRVRESLQARLTQSPSVVQLAAELGTNRFTLMRDFKRRFATTPHAFLLTLRVERARELLARGSNIAEVALACGFSDQAHLTRCFKRVVGVTPGEYARRVRAHTVVR